MWAGQLPKVLNFSFIQLSHLYHGEKDDIPVIMQSRTDIRMKKLSHAKALEQFLAHNRHCLSLGSPESRGRWFREAGVREGKSETGKEVKLIIGCISSTASEG